ncbi:hypothetical protein GON09_005248 [Rhodococcus sp. B50]|nr:hypothetical protein [Rhodococcus sp. B50]
MGTLRPRVTAARQACTAVGAYRQLQRGGQQLGGRDDVIDQTHLVGAVGIDRVAGKDHFEGPFAADMTW